MAELDGVFYPDGSSRYGITGDNEMEWWRKHTATLLTRIGEKINAARWVRGTIPNGTDLNNLKGAENAGMWSVNTGSAVATMLNGPAENTTWPYTLDVRTTTTGITTQTMIPYGGGHAIYVRAYANSTGTSWTRWRRVAWADEIPSGDGGTAVQDAGPYRREDLVSRFLMRRGGTIGTGGKAAVALRFDHHLNFFQDKVLPLLQQYHLPWAQIVNPERVGTYPTDSNVTWAQLQDMALQYGGEIWNHGGNHGDATTEAALRAQIVDALTAMQTNLPLLAIEGWAPPGLVDGAYIGASPFKTTAQNTETYAGQLIMGHHAAVAGYAPGLYRVLDGSLPIGAPHLTIDKATPEQIATHLTNVTDRDAGFAMMLHPNYLDTEGYMTTAQLDAVLADIAARRDRGELVVLSYSGLWVADARTAHRHDMAPKWARKAGATRAAGEAYPVTVSTYNADQHLGATKEAVVKVTTQQAGTVAVSIAGKPTTTHTVPAGTATIRRPVTVGIGAPNLTVTVTPSVAATVDEVHFYAV